MLVPFLLSLLMSDPRVISDKRPLPAHVQQVKQRHASSLSGGVYEVEFKDGQPILTEELKQLLKEKSRADVTGKEWTSETVRLVTGETGNVLISENDNAQSYETGNVGTMETLSIEASVTEDGGAERSETGLTIIAPKFSGFDKGLQSSKESFFITNDNLDTLTEVTVELTYMTKTGKMLHKRSVTHQVEIPSGETRRVDVPTWDIQHQFYYFRTAPTPKRIATPFQVRITPLKAGYLHRAAATERVSDLPYDAEYD